ncbi:S8 family peptidase [Haloferula sp. A504]|uniref:S8 family peptidase n=1 Tax=Haloferula sp. A504 TaxID=3373601 RepID=UPI0031CAE057|nr:S8 family serine peptidase [Verrucomicrobiaceae bacterium E54]
MRHWKSIGLILLVTAAGLILGSHLGNQAGKTPEPKTGEAAPARQARSIDDPAPLPPRSGERESGPDRTRGTDAPPGALYGERTVTFSSAEAMRRFLASLDGTGISVIGSIDALNTLRLRLDDPGALAGLLDESDEIGYIFPAEIPGQGSIQPGAVAFGETYLRWLGADGDRTAWGKGVVVAVLDTGVVSGSAFGQAVSSMNLVELPTDGSTINGHGTAVASLIAGKDGLAPDARVLDYRIARDDGTSDTFLIAQAVLAATDGGADIINISLGSSGRSVLLEQAIRYANEAGVLVVASAGNNGAPSLSYPAAYDNVIGVGAVDGLGEHLDFSNSGNPSITAPGLALTTAGADGRSVSFSGTSASSPVVVGAIAATMTQEGLNAWNAWSLIEQTANEAGAPGYDPAYGAGILNVGRALNHDIAGINDIAIAANHVTLNEAGNPIVQVTVENRGTARVINAPVSVTTQMGESQLNVTSLAPGATQTFDLPLGSLESGARIESSVELSGGGTDQNPANNRRVDVVAPQESP